MQYERKKLNMKTNKLSLILYLIGGLVVFVPISIVLITGNAFSPFYSKIFLTTAMMFIIIGRTLTVVKKAKENRTIPWYYRVNTNL